LSIAVGNAGPVAHQTPGIHELAQEIDCRNVVTRSQLYDLLPLSEQKWIRVDNQTVYFLLGMHCEGRLNFTFIAGVQYSDLQTERARCGLHIVRLRQTHWKFRIDQYSERARIRYKLVGKL